MYKQKYITFLSIFLKKEYGESKDQFQAWTK